MAKADYYETLGGGMGASSDCNGRSARHSHMTNTLNTPVEVLELNYPDHYYVQGKRKPKSWTAWLWPFD